MPRYLPQNAPGFLGALFCSIFLLAATSCERSGLTPDWDTYAVAAGAPNTEAGSGTSSAAEPIQPPESSPETTSETSNDSASGFRFISYNVKNWLTMERYVDGKAVEGKPKPDLEKAAVITLLTRHLPDVIGISEIGTLEDLKEIQSMLKAAGLDLPHHHYSGGSDAVRHLGLLSRFPITSTSSPEVTEYPLEGKTFGIQRGVMDASLDAGGKLYRLLGVHLKSKRESEEADQEDMRVNEARLLRRHVDDILKTDPNSRLVVFGDFNDTRNSTTVTSITGAYNSPGYLTAIPAKDSRGESWTHYWSYQDIYSRIDFITVSQAMKPDVDFPNSRIIDEPEWKDASDHRPILAVFR